MSSRRLKTTKMTMSEVALPKLPKCDVCKAFDRPVANDANADSKTILGPWGYTCEEHRGFREGPITWLRAEET